MQRISAGWTPREFPTPNPRFDIIKPHVSVSHRYLKTSSVCFFFFFSGGGGGGGGGGGLGVARVVCLSLCMYLAIKREIQSN